MRVISLGWCMGITIVSLTFLFGISLIASSVNSDVVWSGSCNVIESGGEIATVECGGEKTLVKVDEDHLDREGLRKMLQEGVVTCNKIVYDPEKSMIRYFEDGYYCG